MFWVMKGSATTNLEGRSNYGSSMPDSPKYAANEYVPSSSRSYGQKVDQLYSDRISEYPSVDRLQYADRHSAYLGRNLPSETADRYAESVAFGHDSQVLNYAMCFFLHIFSCLYLWHLICFGILVLCFGSLNSMNVWNKQHYKGKKKC